MAEAIARLAGRHFRSFGPQELSPFIEGLLPVEFTECYDEVTLFACPKDDIDLVATRVVERLSEFTCVFVNEVFVAFSSDPADRAHAAPADAVRRHLPYFNKRLAALRAGEPMRTTRYNPRFRIGDFGPHNRGRRVLIVNASLTENFGDELLADATHDLCRAAIPDAEIIVSGPQVDRTLIAKADHIVLGGAGVLYEFRPESATADLRNIANYFKYGYYARQYGSTFTVLGVGHQQVGGRFMTSAGPRFLRGALQDAAAITTRDADTVELLRRELLAPDYAALVSGEDLSFAWLQAEPLRKGPIGRVTFVGADLAAAAGAAAMLRLAHEAGLAIRVVLQAREDPDLVRLAERTLPGAAIEQLDLRTLGVADGVAAFLDTDAVVTGRFHAMVMAAAGGLPQLAVDFENGKRERLARRLYGEAWREVIVRREDSAETARERMAALLAGKTPRRSYAAMQELMKTRRQNLDVLREKWLGKAPRKPARRKSAMGDDQAALDVAVASGAT